MPPKYLISKEILICILLGLIFLSPITAAPKKNNPKKNSNQTLEIKSISPNKGSATGEYTVTIKAKGLQSDTKVKFSGIEQQIIKKSKNSLKVKVSPVNQASKIDVEMIHSSGKKAIKKNGFEYLIEKPILSSVFRKSGPVYGGTRLFIKGKNFSKDMTLTVGNSPANLIKIINHKRALFSTGPGSIGKHDISITNQFGSAVLKDAFTYTEASPVVRRVFPNKAKAEGGKIVRIFGKNFRPETKVYFDGVLATTTIVKNQYHLTTKTPALPIWNKKKVDLTIETPYGSFVAKEAFTIFGQKDDSAPNITFTSPTNPNQFQGPLPSVTAQLEDSLSGIDLSSLKLTLNENVINTYLIEGNTLSWTSNTNLTQGSYTFKIEVKDVAENLATEQILLNIDATQPIVQMNSPKLNEFFSTSVIDISGNLSDADSGVDLNDFTISIDQAPYAVSQNNGFFSLNSSELSDGEHTLTTTISDNVGNRTDFSRLFYIDTTPPEISISSPLENSYISSNIMHIQGQITDLLSGVNLQNFTFKFDQTPVAAEIDEEGQYSFYISNFSEGIHQINIETEDNLGNYADKQIAITVDQSSPLLSITNPSEDNLTFTTATPTIAATYNDLISGINISSIRIFIDDEEQVYETGIRANDFELVLNELEAGDYILRVDISDFAGFTTSLIRPFSINLDPPDPVGVVLNNFGRLQTLTNNVNAKNLKIVDKNGDGKLDIVFKDINVNQIKVLYQ